MGAMGPPGFDGDAGEDGMVGPPGPQGAQGPAGPGGSGATGTAIVDFGPWPGTTDAIVAVSQPTILGTSIVQAWLFPVDTSDHSADEHRVERVMVLAGAPTAGVGFDVFARVDAEQVSAPETVGPSRFRSAAATVFGFVSPSGGGLGSLLYGKWTVAWRWS